MKKLFLALCMVIGLTGCSTPNADITGEWRLISIAAGENVIEGDALVAIYPDGIMYNFKEDGSLVIESFGQTAVGSWTIDGNTITMVKPEGGVEGTLEDGLISFLEGGISFILEVSN